MIIAVDFDGTCVTHEYPAVGHEIGAVPVLKELSGKGHSLILWTMRSGLPLSDAIHWFGKNKIPLLGVNENPGQSGWTTSPKAYAQLYIDDMGLGAPLIEDDAASDKPYINWTAVRKILTMSGAL